MTGRHFDRLAAVYDELRGGTGGIVSTIARENADDERSFSRNEALAKLRGRA